MAQNVVESIFNSRRNLSQFFPQFPGVKVFDLHKKHLFYGRIDIEGDAVYLDDSNIKQIQSGRTGTHLAVDFVCRAFSDLRKNIRSAANKNYISKDSLYPTNLRVSRSWITGDLEYSYDQYLNKLYTTFVNSYLNINNRSNKIKNYRDFIREFVNFILKTAEYFPLTKTGFITSIHASPFISGLMVEVAKENHGLQTNRRILDYVDDPNFSFFVNEVRKFGFMVDKNAPWRMVFNLASGLGQTTEDGELLGGQFYMEKFAVNFNNVFPVYFRKAHLDELSNLKAKIYSLYESFYLQFSTYQTTEYVKCVKEQYSYDLRFKSARKNRQPPKFLVTAPSNPSQIKDMDDLARREAEFWLKILLKLRMSETETQHNPHNFDFFASKIVYKYRLFGENTALEEINNLTKGFNVSNFITRGDYWYGMSEKEYQSKRAEALKNAEDPSLVDYALSGTKNLK